MFILILWPRILFLLPYVDFSNCIQCAGFLYKLLPPPLDTHSFSIVARDGSISYSCLISLLFFYFCTSTPAVGPSSAPKFFIQSWLIFLVYTDRAGPIILTMVEGFHPQTGLTSISFTIRRRLWKLAGQGHLNRQTNQAYQTKSGQKKNKQTKSNSFEIGSKLIKKNNINLILFSGGLCLFTIAPIQQDLVIAGRLTS